MREREREKEKEKDAKKGDRIVKETVLLTYGRVSMYRMSKR